MSRIFSRRDPPERPHCLAGGLGFEPRFSESESDVLPLNYPPPRRAAAPDLRAWNADRHVRGAESRVECGRYKGFRRHGPPLQHPFNGPGSPSPPASAVRPGFVVGSLEELDPTYGLIRSFARSTVAFGVA